MERIEKLQQYLALNPADSFLRHALALEYVKLGDDDRAKSEFIRLLTADPDYTGSYYHLAKLLERNQLPDDAVEWYKKGMAVARAAGDNHAYNELRSAHDELLF